MPNTVNLSIYSKKLLLILFRIMCYLTPYRPMIQTRHSFATTAISLGENPLWIAHIMGHRDTDMIIKVYTKYLKNAVNNNDGNALNEIYSDVISNHEEA